MRRWICVLVVVISVRSALLVGAETSPLDGIDQLIARGHYAEARARSDSADRLARTTGNTALAAEAELARGTIWQSRGFAQPAVQHFARALDLAEQTANRQLVARVYGALAAAHADLGHWDRVLDYAERQREADDRHTPSAEFQYLFQRGVAFEEVHDATQARTALDAALATATTVGDPRLISMATGELAAVVLDADRDRPRAIAMYEEALDIAQRARLPDLQATWLLDLGAVLKEDDDYAGARRRIEQALAVERSSGARRVTPAALKDLAQVLLKNGDRARAATALVEAAREADEQNLTALRWEVRVEQASMMQDESPGDAERLFGDALDILEESQGSVLVEQLRSGTLARALASADPYDLLIDFLLKRDRVADAFFVAERGRARGFLDSLRTGSDEIARALPPEYLELEASLLADISEGQAALRAGRLLASERRALDAAIRSDEDQLGALRLRLAADRPAIAAVRYPQLWHAADLSSRVLAPGQALVQFFLGEKSSTVWVVDPKGIQVTRLPSRDTIEHAARRYLDAVSHPVDAQEPTTARELYTVLFSRVTIPDSVSEVVVVPDGVLYDVPFEALRDTDGRRLIERFALSYAPSASSFALLSSRGRSPRQASILLALGNPVVTGAAASGVRGGDVAQVGLLKPLPFASVEVRDIAGLYAPSSRVLEAAKATEAALRDGDLSTVSILHFATHGFIDEEQPERSALVLSASAPDDGLLQMREVYGLHLNDALVTLSACETALGAHVRGEGIVGLSRAFFYAGADVVVASLWSVNDRSTAALMEAFYRALASGLPVAAALREAKLAALHGNSMTSPYYWAGFVALGNGSWRGGPPAGAMRSSRTAMFYVAALVGPLVLLMGVIWARRRRSRKPAMRS